MAERDSNIGKTCSVEGCDKRASRKLMCDAHYRRMQRNGTLETIRQSPGSLVDIGKYFTKNVNGVTKRYHVYIAETALGKPLPPNAIVHHVDENGKNNANDNLVICPDRAYHNYIHMRMRALAESGNANNRKCEHCKTWDSIENMSSYSKRGGITSSYYHKKCAAETAAKNKQRRQMNAVS